MNTKAQKTDDGEMSESISENHQSVKHFRASDCLNTCIAFVEENNAPADELLLLRKLQNNKALLYSYQIKK